MNNVLQAYEYANDVLSGIIYKYISPSGKVYIGQTVDEKDRRRRFWNLNALYCSQNSNKLSAFDYARRKYELNLFKYSILCKVEANNYNELKLYLNRLEKMYIKKYDSYKNGYNSTIGGGNTTGYKHTADSLIKMSKVHKGKKLSKEHIEAIKAANKNRTVSEETKLKLKDAKNNYIAKCDDNMNIISVYKSATEANTKENISLSGISSVLHNRQIKAGGFKWKKINKEEYERILTIQ